MIQMNLKRIYENNSCTHGILTIPAYHFRCLTLELRDGDDLSYKHDCRIPEGSYTLIRGFAQQWPSFPVFKKKLKGFAKRPEFNLSANTYMKLPTGHIALGTAKLDDFSIQQSDDLATAFKEIFRDVFIRKQIVTLCIFKSNSYRYEDVTYHQHEEMSYDFLKNDDEDEDELENNPGNG